MSERGRERERERDRGSEREIQRSSGISRDIQLSPFFFFRSENMHGYLKVLLVLVSLIS